MNTMNNLPKKDDSPAEEDYRRPMGDPTDEGAQPRPPVTPSQLEKDETEARQEEERRQELEKIGENIKEALRISEEIAEHFDAGEKDGFNRHVNFDRVSNDFTYTDPESGNVAHFVRRGMDGLEEGQERVCSVAVTIPNRDDLLVEIDLDKRTTPMTIDNYSDEAMISLMNSQDEYVSSGFYTTDPLNFLVNDSTQPWSITPYMSSIVAVNSLKQINDNLSSQAELTVTQ